MFWDGYYDLGYLSKQSQQLRLVFTRQSITNRYFALISTVDRFFIYIIIRI